MLNPVGFWSYARDDDSHSDGQLSELRAIVGRAINLRQGEDVALWQDIDAIPLGAKWLETINSTIEQVTFFIPIVSPRFLKSVHCRDEFRVFRNRMEALGRNDLVFPVYYVDVENFKPESTAFGDELSALEGHQWKDFRSLIHESPTSPKVKQWAGELATGILDALRRAPPPPKTVVTRPPPEIKRPPPRPPTKIKIEPIRDPVDPDPDESSLKIITNAGGARQSQSEKNNFASSVGAWAAALALIALVAIIFALLTGRI